MPYCNYSRNIPLFKGLTVKKFLENSDGSFSAYLEMPKTDHICPHCGHSTSYIKDYRTQIVKDVQMFGQDVFIHLRKRRYLCKHCGHSFTEANPLVYRYQHFTSRFYLLAYKEFREMQPFKAVSKRFGVSVTSIIRWFDKINHPLPKLSVCFSIDEFKGNANNEKFQCNVADPVTHKVLDILPSRNIESLCRHFLKYPLYERGQVENVVIDLSTAFRSSINLLFPNAKIIADKFHVIRLVTWSMEGVRKRIQKQFHKQRRRWFKRSKKILMAPEAKLSIEDKSVLNQMLTASHELEQAHILKERFYGIFKVKTQFEAKNELQNWFFLAEQFNLPEFKHCITTFTKWSDEITRIVEHNVSNGYTEGVNNKIKVLKRISFGIRNFNRFRNRILYLCS